jgi:zinc transport system substrate-binding protein
MTEPHSHEGEEHQDVDSDNHEEGELDPHIWVSPALVKIQAQNIHAALVKVAPQYEEEFSQNLGSFLADIDALELDMQNTLADIGTQKFLVFHPSWGYFADEFGLEMIAIEVGGTEPSAAELGALIEEAQEEGIRVVFAQPEFSIQDASTIAEAIGGEVILISPLAYDWLANMQLVAEKFAEVLQ